MRHSLSLLVLLPLLLLTAGCDPTTTVGPSPDAGLSLDSGMFVEEGASLAFIGPESLVIEDRSEAEIAVRYVSADGEPIADGRVSFEIVGEAGGARMSERNVFTNAQGVAEVTIRSDAAASFRVQAAAMGAEGDELAVAVEALVDVNLQVTPDYSGTRRVADIEVGIFSDAPCADLSTVMPTPEMVHRTRAGDSVLFTDLGALTRISVFALGYTSDDAVAAFRCKDVDVSAGEVEMELQDVLRTEGGSFDMNETFDVTEANGTLDFLLGAADGLATDPADWLIDLALESGRLSGFVETALRASRSLIGGFINHAIRSQNGPAYVDDLLDAASGVEGVFAEMTLVGTLTVREPDEFGNALAIHRLHEVRVPVDGELVSRPLSDQSVDDVAVVFGDVEQTIAAHTFDNVPLGEVVTLTLNEVVLPRFPGSPRSMTEMIDGLIDCRGLAENLDGVAGAADALLVTAAELACEAGINYAGQRIEDELGALFDYNRLTLSGAGRSTDGDADFLADAYEGTADAIWSSASDELSFRGSLAGEWQGGPPNRLVDRVAERFSTFR
ncbi:MAG: Ig-like domain-containing protein [Myxococcota bacterium]